MFKKMRLAIAALSVGMALVVLGACDSSGDDPVSSTGGSGHLTVQLTDMPLDMDTVQNVHVTIDSVIVFGVNLDGSDGEKIELMPRAETFDLLTLTGGVTTLLAEGDLPAGFYNKIRLGVPSASITFQDSTSADLQIESRKVDINVPFEIATSEDLEVTLDFDAGASLHIVGTGSGKFILRPVVKALKVTNPDPVPLPGPDPNGDPNGTG